MMLAANIREFRKKKGLTQKELAQILGVSRESVVKYELDQSRPSVESLIILAEQFEVTLDRLVLGRETSIKSLDLELEERLARCGGRKNAMLLLDVVLSMVASWKHCDENQRTVEKG